MVCRTTTILFKQQMPALSTYILEGLSVALIKTDVLFQSRHIWK